MSVNDPAPPAGASTDQLVNGASFGGPYGGTAADCYMPYSTASEVESQIHDLKRYTVLSITQRDG